MTPQTVGVEHISALVEHIGALAPARLATTTAHAARSLLRSPLRSGLSCLGIIVGIGSVVAMLCIGDGARARVEAAILKLNGNVVLLYSVSNNAGRSPANTTTDGLNIQDYPALRSELPAGVRITPALRTFGLQAQANGRAISVSLSGVDSSAAHLLTQQILTGSWFGVREVKNAASVCVLSATTARRLFGDEHPIGKTIYLLSVPLSVVGVLSDQDVSATGTQAQEDLSVFLPYSSLLKRLGQPGQTTFLVEAPSPQALEEVRGRVLNILEAHRGRRGARFLASSVTQTVEAYTESTRTLTILLASIGGISIVVGGIGVMNTMFLTVKERTREIGVRLALGTRPEQVFWLFAFEAVLLSASGGMIGVTLGTATAEVITRANEWPMKVSLATIAVGCLCSVVAGVLFGASPARRAAHLAPITALRAE